MPSSTRTVMYMERHVGQKACDSWLQLKLHGARFSRQIPHVGATPSFEQLVQTATPSVDVVVDVTFLQIAAEQVSHWDLP